MGLEIRVELSGGADAEETDEAGRALLAELGDSEVGDVRAAPVAVAHDGGTKGVDLARIGDLLVVLGDAPEALRKLVGAVRDWLGRDRHGFSARIVLGGDELVIERASEETQLRLVEAFLAAHPAAAPAGPPTPAPPSCGASEAGHD